MLQDGVLSLYVVPGAVILAGSALGLFLAARNRPGTVDAVGGRREDLTETHHDAIEGLRALELEKHKLPDDEYRRQRDALLDQGARALRALEEDVPAPPPTSPPDPDAAIRASLEAQRATLGDAAVDAALAKLDAGPRRVSPAWTGAAYTLAVVAFLGALWWAIGSDVVARRDGAPMTGIQDLGQAAGPAATPAPPAAPPPAVADWTARLETDPDDLEAHNGLTEWAIGNQDLASAMAHNTAALRIAPDDPDARVYRAYLMMSIGREEDALALLDTVRAEFPDHVKAMVYQGLIALSAGHPDAAIPALEAALARNPEGADFLRDRLEVARARARGEAPAVPPPPPRSPAAGRTLASGQIRLSPATRAALTGREVVFVSIRDPAGGPPAAAKRLPATSFPLDFVLTSGDAIAMGGRRPSLPDPFDLSIRIDGDGDPMTRPPSDPATVLRGLSAGTTDLVIDL